MSALIVLAVGLLYTLQGFRFGRLLMCVTAAGGCAMLGAIVAAIVQAPVWFGATVAGVIGLAIALSHFRTALVMSAIVVGAATCQLLTARFTSAADTLLIATGVGAVGGGCLQWVCLRSLPVMLTAIQGAFLLIVGFVGLMSSIAPGLASTFVSWSNSIPLMTPVMMTMLYVLGYSVQANAQQGDMRSGGSRDSTLAELV